MKSSFFWKISWVLNLVLLLLLVFLIFQTQFFRLKAHHEINYEIAQELTALGGLALISEDVPVGAVVVYNNKVIGRGFNTVFRDSNISSHAEINAINDAISNTSVQEFLDLDRSKLTIYSTYEPCEMCKGMMVHYRISDAKFLKDKSAGRWLKNDWAGLFYEMNKQQTGKESIQDSLFLLHPRYPGKE